MPNYYLNPPHKGKKYVGVNIDSVFTDKPFITSNSWLQELHDVLEKGIVGKCYRIIDNTLQVEDDGFWHNLITFKNDAMKFGFKTEVEKAIKELDMIFDYSDEYGYYVPLENP